MRLTVSSLDSKKTLTNINKVYMDYVTSNLHACMCEKNKLRVYRELKVGLEQRPIYPVNYPLNCASGSNSLHLDTRLILHMCKNEHLQTEHVLIIVVIINTCNRQALKFYNS